MSEASKFMRVMADKDPNEQQFGYVYIDNVSTKKYPYGRRTCEVCLRDRHRDLAFTLQLSNLDRGYGTYNILVGLAESPIENPLLFTAEVSYFDRGWISLRYDMTLMNRDILEFSGTLMGILHAIVYDLIIFQRVPDAEPGCTKIRYLLINSREKQKIEDDASIKIRDLFESMRTFIPR
jgi:hypothetical protein